MNQTLLAFDYGTRKIGVAAGQDVTGTTQGIGTIATGSKRRQWDEIETLIKEWQPDKLVVGLPMTASGRESAMIAQARKFGEELEKRFLREKEQHQKHTFSLEALQFSDVVLDSQ